MHLTVWRTIFWYPMLVMNNCGFTNWCFSCVSPCVCMLSPSCPLQLSPSTCCLTPKVGHEKLKFCKFMIRFVQVCWRVFAYCHRLVPRNCRLFTWCLMPNDGHEQPWVWKRMRFHVFDRALHLMWGIWRYKLLAACVHVSFKCSY